MSRHAKRQFEHPAQSNALSKDATLDQLAAKAISVVAARAPNTKDRLKPEFVRRLLDACLDRSSESYRAVARRMLAAGISPESIVDDYIPVVARQSGGDWVENQISFASVSIGSTRLQSLLRELSTYWTADQSKSAASDTQAVLVATAHGTDHTLGAAVLSTQLRREGLSVRQCYGIAPRALKVILSTGDFDAVLFSAAQNDRLDKLRVMVEIAKTARREGAAPVVIGGTVLDQEADIRKETGADLTTNDLREMLEFCKLNRSGTQL